MPSGAPRVTRSHGNRYPGGRWLCGRGVGSDPNDGLDSAVGYGFDEAVVIALVLVGVAAEKSAMALSKVSSVPRYLAMAMGSPDRAWARASPAAHSGVERHAER